MPQTYENAKECVKLEEDMIDAHYLGLSLRALARSPNFRYASITAFVGDLLIGWARFVGAQMQAGEPPFLAGAPSEPVAAGRRRRR